MPFTRIPRLLLIFLFIGIQITYAQTNKDKALGKAKQGVTLVDNGKIDDGIKLLEEAQKLDPGNIDYPYEIAYAYYSKKEYKKAKENLESILTHKNVNDRVYQLLGNTYDNLGKSDKAIETYENGLRKFPNAGNLYLELGIMQLGTKNYDKALSYFEKGVEKDPAFPSNYYWASKLYCSSTEEVWGMLYGEIFMNLERNSKRTSEISKLLYDTYKSQIKFTSDTSFSVSFSQFMNVKAGDKMKLPFGVGIYEPTLMYSMLNEKAIDLNSLDRMRKNFVKNYYKNGHNKTYPNLLIDYQKKVLDAGHLEAYNHWILMKGDEDAFGKWQAANKDKWNAFITWFTDNGLVVDNKNKFYREMY